MPFCLLLAEGDGGEGGEDAEVSSEVVKEASPPSENPDQEVIVEGLKSICNILLHNETGQVSVPFVSSYCAHIYSRAEQLIKTLSKSQYGQVQYVIKTQLLFVK